MKASVALAIGGGLLLIITIIGAVMASGVGSIGMSATVWFAYGLGALLTIVVGSGLVMLTFYSSRNGYDDIDRPEDGPD